MQGSTVRISAEAKEILEKLADEENESMQSVLHKALETYRRERFLEASNEAFAALRKDKRMWGEELRERKEWDATSRDDVDKDQ